MLLLQATKDTVLKGTKILAPLQLLAYNRPIISKSSVGKPFKETMFSKFKLI